LARAHVGRPFQEAEQAARAAGLEDVTAHSFHGHRRPPAWSANPKRRSPIMSSMSRARLALVALPALALGLRAAEAAPTVRITPPAGARFAVDQAFDIRAEYAPSSGQALTAVTLAVDGVSVALGVGGAACFAGVCSRTRPCGGPGAHTIPASATDATGT